MTELAVFDRRPFKLEHTRVIGTWIQFYFFHASPSGKTEVWTVEGANGHEIGFVYWHAPWRKYAFEPLQRTIFEEKCLREISLFVRILTKAHKARKAA